MENVSTLSKVVSAVSQSKNSKSQSSSYADIKDPKRRYYAVIQQEKQNEREKVHQRNEQSKKEEEKRKKQNLKQEITRRRRELEYLEKEKESGVEENKKATFIAQIKQEKDKIKKIQQEIRAKTLDQVSKARYKQAVQRQRQINKVTNRNKTQANSMRKTHRVTEEDERQKALEYQRKSQIALKRQKEQTLQTQKQLVKTYKDTILRHGLSERLIDGTRIGPLVIKQNQEDQSAIKLGELQQLKNSQREKIRTEVMNRNRKTAELRGQKALSKMQRQRQYEEYCREAQQQQKRYNVRRLEAGKKNQLSGVKPMTISQMSLNKKNRNEQEFQQMFLKQKELKSSNKPVGKYTVIQTKMINKVPIQKKIQRYHKRPINYASNQSLIPGQSEGHYSFQSQSSRGRKSTSERKLKPKEKKSIQISSNDKGILKDDQPAVIQSLGKTKMAQTRVDNKPHRQELDYSSSQQDSN